MVTNAVEGVVDTAVGARWERNIGDSVEESAVWNGRIYGVGLVAFDCRWHSRKSGVKSCGVRERDSGSRAGDFA